MGEKIKTTRKKKFRKTAAIVLAALAVVSVCLALAAPGYVKRHLNDYILASSGGEYQLSFSDIRANLYTQTVRIDSLKLIPQQTNQAHYAVSAAHLKASGISAFDFLFHKKLKIKLLQIQQPEFEIFGQDGQKRDALNQQELAQMLLPFFTNNLKEVSIEEIRLEQAVFDHYRINDQSKSLSSIKDLNVGIRQFRMDSSIISGGNEFFKAEDIYVRINDYNRALGDSIHQLQVEELTYSIEHNSIYGKNLSLFPNDTSNHSSTLYWIKIPEIRLSAQNLRSILGNDSVNIDSVSIINSDIRVRPGRAVKKINFRELKEYDLYELIRHDFSFIHVNHLKLHANKLFFEPKRPDLDNSQVFTDVDASALNFRLDSVDDRQLNKVLYSDNINLRVKSYSLKLNDQVHLFEANNIVVSSFDSLLKAEAISLSPVKTEHTVPVTVKLTCDSLIVQQVDLARLFHFREMPLNALSVYQPNVTVNQLVEKEADNDTDEQSLLYRFISDYIKGVYANKIAINNGHIEFNDLRKQKDEGHISTDFDFRLTQFSLDSASARGTDKLFFASNLELKFKNYQMKLADQLHQLFAKNVEVSSLKQIVVIDGLRLSPDKNKNVERTLKRLNRSELYDIRIPRLSLQNTNIHHAFFQKTLNINNFNIEQPKIYLEVFAHERRQEKKLNIDEFYELLSDYITDINIENFTVEDGNFQLVTHSQKGKSTNLTNRFSLNLERFRLNEKELQSKRILFSDNFALRVNDHLFKLSDNVHYLKAAEISFTSKNSTGVIKNALLYPEISSEAYEKLPWHFQISIPLIRLNKVDLENAVFNEMLNVGAVEIDSPVIQFYKNVTKKEQDKFNLNDLNVPLPEEIKELNLGKLQLKKGKLIIRKTIDGSNDQVAEAAIGFTLDQVNMKRSENISTARFSAKSIETNINDLQIWPGKIPYTIDVKKLRFSSTDQLLDLQELNIRNKGRSEDQIVSISLPSLRFEQLDPTEAFDHNRFHTARLLVSDPVFNLRRIEGEQRKNPLYIKLSPDLYAIMDELSAGEVEISNATLNLIGKQKTSKLDQIDVTMREVQLDSTRALTPLGAKDLTIVRRNIKYTDPDKLYDILIDRFDYSTLNKNLLLNGLHIIPRYGPDQFQQHIDFQQDYYSGDVQQINFENIDLNRWFENREFTGKNIDINQLNLLIYRDKRIPVNDQKYPPMLQDLLRSIELPFYFDTVKLNNSNFIYSEQLEEIPEPGRVSFEKLNARLYPFTNLKYLQATNSDLHLNASTLLMGVSELKAQLKFNMQSQKNRFEAHGSLSPFDMTAMNQITENAASISIRSGQLNRFDFEFSGDSTVANGKLRFAYDDLKITILAHKDGNTKEAKFLSFLANSLMVKSKHPRTRILLPDDIHFYRDPNKSTLNYLWKSVFSGAKNTFGVKEDQN